MPLPLQFSDDAAINLPPELEKYGTRFQMLDGRTKALGEGAVISAQEKVGWLAGWLAGGLEVWQAGWRAGALALGCSHVCIDAVLL
jgi:hypothetical protein